MRLIGEARTGSIQLSIKGGLPVVEEEYGYIIEADTATDNRLSVLNSIYVPSIGAVMPSGVTLAKSKAANRRAGRTRIWDVTVSASSEVEEDQSEGQPGTNPEAWVPVRETTFERLDTIEFEDRLGNPCMASNKEWYQTGIKRRRFLPVWDFWQFEPATVTDEQMADRNETVNDDTFKGKAAKTLLLTINKSLLGTYYGARRRLTQYRLVYNSRTWVEKRVDYGSFYWSTPGDPPSGTQFRFVDGMGATLPNGKLDGSGGKLAAATDPEFIEFDVYEPIDFQAFLRI